MDKAIAYCLERELYNAVDCRDTASWFHQQVSDTEELSGDNVIKIVPDWLKVKATSPPLMLTWQDVRRK
jgi:hypothetical protein